MNNVPATPTGWRRRLLSRLLARPLLWRMLMRQGIDPAEPWWHGSEGLMDRVVTRCTACTHSDECHDWLTRAPLRTAPPDFCRNRHTLMACRNLERAAAPPGAAPEPEPPIAEVVRDPIIRLMMTADGIAPDTLRRTLDTARRPQRAN